MADFFSGWLPTQNTTNQTRFEICLKGLTVLAILSIPTLIDFLSHSPPALDESHGETRPDTKPETASSNKKPRARTADSSKAGSRYSVGNLSLEEQDTKGGNLTSEASILPDTESSQETSNPQEWSTEPSQSDTNTSNSSICEAQENHESEMLDEFMAERNGPWDPTRSSGCTLYQEPLPKVLADLNIAMQSSQWHRRQQNQYADVRVLVLAWRNGSEGVRQEVNRLEYCFRSKYHFTVDRFQIPDNKKASSSTERAILDFTELDKGDLDWSQTLLILYYAGHGQRNKIGTHRWIPEGQDPEETTQIFVNPERAVGLFTDQSRAFGFDALVLLDCCNPITLQAPESHIQDSVCEVLAATGDGVARGPGDNSFTKLLTDELYVALESEGRISVADLHSNLTAKCLQPQNNVNFRGTSVEPVEDTSRPGHTRVSGTVRRVPAHRFISKSTTNHRSIVLGPLTHDSKPSESPAEMATQPISNSGGVILAVHIDEDLEVAQPALRRWLFGAPAAVRDIDIKIWKLIPCSSSIMIIQVPIHVWDLLPSSPAVTFLGFANTDKPQPMLSLARWQMPIMDASSQIDNTIPDFVPMARPPYIWKALNHGVVCEDGSYLARNFLHITELNPNEPLLTPTEKQEYLKSGRRLDSFVFELKDSNTPGRLVKKRTTWDGASELSPDHRQTIATSRNIGAKDERDLQSAIGSSGPSSRYSSPARMSTREREHSRKRRDESVSGRQQTHGFHKRMESIESIAEMPDETQNSKDALSGDLTEVPVVDHDSKARDEPECTQDVTEGEELDEIEETDVDHLSTRPPSYFVPGKVFKMLWTEPLDEETRDSDFRAHYRRPSTDKYLTGDTDEPNGEQRPFWVGFLRFIVVSRDTCSCVCVPISTYGGKGCTREEIRAQASTHGIIYQDGNKPEKLSNEPELGVSPVKIILSENGKDGENIARESRVNYARPIKIKYTVKVLFIGELDQSGKAVMEKAVQECTPK